MPPSRPTPRRRSARRCSAECGGIETAAAGRAGGQDGLGSRGVAALACGRRISLRHGVSPTALDGLSTQRDPYRAARLRRVGATSFAIVLGAVVHACGALLITFGIPSFVDEPQPAETFRAHLVVLVPVLAPYGALLLALAAAHRRADAQFARCAAIVSATALAPSLAGGVAYALLLVDVGYYSLGVYSTVFACLPWAQGAIALWYGLPRSLVDARRER